MTNPARKRLIEELLPLAEIGVESSKSVSNGDIHAIHTWFARRPLAACRAATFAALVDAPTTEDERDALMKLIIESLPADAPQTKPQVFAEMRERVLGAFEGQEPRMLDPFAGGGSLPLEATRLGCEAYAQDLNPNAILTLLGTVDYPIRFGNLDFPLPVQHVDGFADTQALERRGNLVTAVEEWGDWVLDYARKRLDSFYKTSGDNSVVAYFWAKTIKCTNPSCQCEIPLVAQRWLRRGTRQPSVAFKLVPNIDAPLAVKILVGPEADDDHPSTGTMASGSVQCPCCPQTVTPAQVKDQFQNGKDGRVMLAVAVRKSKGLEFRPAKSIDFASYEASVGTLREAIASHTDPFFPLCPDEEFPEKARGIELGRYGIRNWGQLFNPRQLLALVTFVDGVKASFSEMRQLGASPQLAQAVALYLAFALSRLSLRLSEASRWHVKGNKIEAATAGHRLPMVWDYVEGNPLSAASGSWKNAINSAMPSLKRILNSAKKPAIVSWGDVTQLAFHDEYFDAVLTDPPYYDSVPYSNLADMQYVWLHRALGDIFPEQFPSPLTPKKAEIMQDNARHGGAAAAKQFFEDRMRMALVEIRRVLKQDGLALVMYAHTDTSAWETLVSALITSGFQVTASWPVNTETRSRQVWLGGAVLQSTIFLVCRKRDGQKVAYLEEILADMHKTVQQALARFWAAGIGGADFFISAIGPALSVFSRYDEVRYSSGQRVSVANFLTLVRQAVVDFSLQQALQGVNLGEVDRETQFALLWRWTYGHQEVETGAALLLDKATGVELAELEKRGLLGRVDNNRRMVLFGPEERPGLIEQTSSRLRGGSVPLIDLIHCADLLWRDNRREELNELLAEQGDAMRKVAQALAEIQRNGYSERRLTLGFLGSWPAGLAPKVQPAPGRNAQIKEQQLAFDLDNPEQSEDE